MKCLRVCLVCILLAAAGCGDDSNGNTEADAAAGTDTGTNPGVDADTNPGLDAGGLDAGTNPGLDAGVSPDGGGTVGCGQDPSGISTTLSVNGVSRTFVLYVPGSYDPNRAYPLIFALHGLGGNGQLAQTYFGIQQQVGADAVIVYPDALPLPSYGGDTGWELNPNGYDFAFFDALYDHLMDHLCVNADRVFATGHSFGGFMSNSLGCYRGNVLNAIAPVAGGPPYYGACQGPVAAWITHGSADTVVALSEGEASRDTWVGVNGCGATSDTTPPAPCVAYDTCSESVHWCLHPGGHEWPSFAAAAIWSFFSAQ